MGVLILVLAFTGNEFLSVPGLTALGVELRQVGNAQRESAASAPIWLQMDQPCL